MSEICRILSFDLNVVVLDLFILSDGSYFHSTAVKIRFSLVKIVVVAHENLRPRSSVEPVMRQTNYMN